MRAVCSPVRAHRRRGHDGGSLARRGGRREAAARAVLRPARRRPARRADPHARLDLRHRADRDRARARRRPRRRRRAARRAAGRASVRTARSRAPTTSRATTAPGRCAPATRPGSGSRRSSGGRSRARGGMTACWRASRAGCSPSGSTIRARPGSGSFAAAPTSRGPRRSTTSRRARSSPAWTPPLRTRGRPLAPARPASTVSPPRRHARPEAHDAVTRIDHAIDAALFVHDGDGRAHLRQGLGDDARPLDVQALGILWLVGRGRHGDARAVERTTDTTMRVSGRRVDWPGAAAQTFSGYRPFADVGSRRAVDGGNADDAPRQDAARAATPPRSTTAPRAGPR